MTLQEFRDELFDIIPEPWRWNYWTAETPDDEYLCAKGIFWKGLQVKITYCECLQWPWHVVIDDILVCDGKTLKEAFQKASDALVEAATKMLEVFQ